MHIPWLRPRYKIALLTLGWVLWFLVGGFAATTQAQTQTPFPEEPALTTPNPYVTQTTPPAGGTPGVNPQQTPPAGGTPTPASTGGGSSVRLTNPLSGINSIPDLLAAILNIVIIIAIPIIILFIMLAGFKYVTANGNSTKVQEASTALLYAVIGGVIIIGATAIAQIIKNLVNAFAAP